MIRRLFYRGACFRAVAILLLALAASPCTAPFSTLDLVPHAPTVTLDGSKTKNANDDMLASLRVSMDPVLIEPAAVPPASAPLVRHDIVSRHAVLRL